MPPLDIIVTIGAASTPLAHTPFHDHLYPITGKFAQRKGKIGGAEEDRTPDLRIANATLSQLSYGPTLTTTDSETRTDTVNFISRFLLLSTF